MVRTDRGQKIQMRNPKFKRNFIVTMTAANLLVWGCAIFVWGCKKSEQSTAASSNGLTKIRVGYIGLTCEAPIFTAVEKGFFKDEGLDPVWSSATGRITRTSWRWADLTSRITWSCIFSNRLNRGWT